MTTVQTKLKAGSWMIPVTMLYDDDRIYFKFKFNRPLMAEIKVMEGAKWHGYDEKPRKLWSVANSPRNAFQLQYLEGKNPYAHYDKELINIIPKRDLYDHQRVMLNQVMTRKRCLLAAEMGVGKSLVAIEVMELSNHDDWWWIGPKSALKSVELELLKWQSSVRPRLLTYEKLKSILLAWSTGNVPPHGVIFDESSRIKNPTAQRSMAALHLANAIREEHGDEGYVVLMSGSPAPRSPVDHWHQCLSGDTWVTTDQGPQQITDLVDRPATIHVDGHSIKTDGFFNTGTRQTYKLVTKEGYTVRATEDHRFLVDYDGLQFWQELQDLEIGDQIVVNDVGRYNSWEGQGTEDDGYIMGLLFGDGHITMGRPRIRPALQFFEDDFCLIPEVLRILGHDTVYPLEDNSLIIRNQELRTLVEQWGVDNHKMINKSMLTASSEFYIGFLRGMFDSDGYVDKDSARVRIKQVNKHNSYIMQQMLLALGIYCKIHRSQNEGSGMICGKKANTLNANYCLTICNNEAVKFHNMIGFNQTKKNNRMIEKISKRKHRQYQRTAIVTEIIKADVEDVYDITVPGIHKFSANGLVAHNCEIACPGFLREGNIHKLKKTLAIIEERESITGGAYPHLVAWRNNPAYCDVCGLEIFEHQADCDHVFTPSVDEVARLGRRMKGLVQVIYKKDCLDLPDKIYRIVRCEPTASIMRAAKLIAAKTPRAAQALVLLRELSDGFQYQDEIVGKTECELCHGERTVLQWDPEQEKKVMDSCPNCRGTGEQVIKERKVMEVDSPKERALIDLLDEHSECGRSVIYAGFQGSIQRIMKICKRLRWAYIKMDGRGIECVDCEGNPYTDDMEMLQALDASHPRRAELLEKFPRLAFIGQPGSGGMGLTFTASPSIIYYGNDFNGESRIQSEDRIHRAGMDKNVGATIIDIIHLPSDEYVLKNLQAKRNLQKQSMNDIKSLFEGVK